MLCATCRHVAQNTLQCTRCSSAVCRDCEPAFRGQARDFVCGICELTQLRLSESGTGAANASTTRQAAHPADMDAWFGSANAEPPQRQRQLVPPESTTPGSAPAPVSHQQQPQQQWSSQRADLFDARAPPPQRPAPQHQPPAPGVVQVQPQVAPQHAQHAHTSQPQPPPAPPQHAPATMQPSSPVVESMTPFVTNPALTEAVAQKQLDNLFLRIGDYGEFVLTNHQSIGARLDAVSATHARLLVDDDAGKVYAPPLSMLSVFIRDDARSRPVKAVAVSATPKRADGSQVHIEQVALLGQGAQGQVWKCRYEDAPPGEYVVVKEMLFTDAQLEVMKQREEQARLVMTLRHEHLIRYLDVRISHRPHKVSVVMPYYDESDLLQFVTNLRKPLTQYHICSLILQLAGALDYLHKRNPPMVHRDVKLENVLMFENGHRTLLMDLDMSRELPGNSRAAMTTCGTYEYMAPEAQKGQASPKSDVWSLGVILYILLAMPDFLTVQHPQTKERLAFNAKEWRQDVLWHTMRSEIAKNGTKRGTRFSSQLVDLVCSMMTQDDRQRPSAMEVIDRLQAVMYTDLTSQ